MQEPFNKDRYLQRQTDADRAEIKKHTREFIKNGGEIKKLSSGLSSGICDLPPKTQQEIKRKLGLIKRANES